MPDTISFDFLHPTQIAIDAGPEGLVAVRLLEWARAARPRGLIHVARSETRAQRLVCALRGLAPQLEVVMLPPWDCLPYDRVGPSRETMGRRIAALRRLTGAILEATGRSGSDAGFDARGSEIIAQVETAIELSDRQ
jgi:transcription-repair coupling factor (superfamily II helicase)